MVAAVVAVSEAMDLTFRGPTVLAGYRPGSGLAFGSVLAAGFAASGAVAGAAVGAAFAAADLPAPF